MSLINLPYYAPREAIPAKLPTLDAIHSAEGAFTNIAGRTFATIGEHFLIKYGKTVELLEGQTTLYLQQSTAVTVPKVYALFEDQSTEIRYIVMEYIQGKSLKEEWPNLSLNTKDTIASKLRNTFETMRKLPSPGAYCSVGNLSLTDTLFYTGNPTIQDGGPFDTENDLNEAFLTKFCLLGTQAGRASYFARGFAKVFSDHKPTFTHGDLQPKNVMLRYIARDSGTGMDIEYDADPILIDWEFAGWYTSYWEYSRALTACGWHKDDWSLYLDKMLEPTMAEHAWLQLVYLEHWG